MTNSYQDALSKLQQAQDALNAQDISQLPPAQLANLEKSKAAVYGEIQALQAKAIEDRDDLYAAMTDSFRDCKSDLTSLSDWATGRKARDQAIFTMLTKGISIALSLLA